MTGATATVRYSGSTAVLTQDTGLVVGRGSAAGIAIGRSPVDTRVSREHLSLSLDTGLVTVTRLSRTQLVLVRTASGTFSLDAPGDSVRRGGTFAVLLPRTPGPGEEPPTYHRLDIIAPGAHDGPGEPSTPRWNATDQTSPRPILTDRERLLLATYARPLLVGSGDRDPVTATHQQVAQTLHYGYDWCRERVDNLRRKLADDGWPVGADKESLCRWAVAMRLVTAEDLPPD